MSRTVELLVQVPDDVYDNAMKVKEYISVSVEAVLSISAEQAMESIAENVRDLVRLHGLEEE